MSETVTVRVQKVKKNRIKTRLICFLILAAALLLVAIFADKIVCRSRCSSAGTQAKHRTGCRSENFLTQHDPSFNLKTKTFFVFSVVVAYSS